MSILIFYFALILLSVGSAAIVNGAICHNYYPHYSGRHTATVSSQML